MGWGKWSSTSYMPLKLIPKEDLNEMARKYRLDIKDLGEAFLITLRNGSQVLICKEKGNVGDLLLILK